MRYSTHIPAHLQGMLTIITCIVKAYREPHQMYDNVFPATDIWALLQIRSSQACKVPEASRARMNVCDAALVPFTHDDILSLLDIQ